MKTPRTFRQWQDAADAADALIALDAARQYGLVTGGPSVNVERCLDILKRARRRGIFPDERAIDRLMSEMSS